MELTNLIQIESEDLQRIRIDCMIAAAGNEPRCIHLAQMFSNVAAKKILLTPEDPRPSRFLQVFNEYGFTPHATNLKDDNSVENIIKDICNIQKDQLNILIDYSCMPKRWYALIIDAITRNNFPASSIRLFLSYTPKVFEKKSVKHSVGYFGPIICNRDNLKDKKPVSMIVALDHNHNTVLEAINKVKPKKLLAFIPHCTHDPEYARLVLENNKALLQRIDSHNIIRYQIDRPEEINTLLTACCLDERVDSEVVIVPQGPKTFSMMSMLLSVRYPDVKLWEIIINDLKISPDHGQPAANPVIVKVSFVNDELD